MATLTAAQLTDIRRVVGDLDAAGNAEFITTDADVQTLHDDVDADFPKTYVAYLRRLVGMTAHKIPVTDSFGRQEEQSQRHENFKALLAVWEKIAGLGADIGQATTRPYRADSLTTSEPDFTEGR